MAALVRVVPSLPDAGNEDGERTAQTASPDPTGGAWAPIWEAGVCGMSGPRASPGWGAQLP